MFHDDQHGTAIVVLAALTNALRVVHKDMASIRVVVSGGGAAGTAIVTLLLAAGVTDVVVCDRDGAICAGDESLSSAHRQLAEVTNPRHVRGDLHTALHGADVFIGVSAPGVLDPSGSPTWRTAPSCSPSPTRTRRSTRSRPRSTPRSWPRGRSDYPNQINNVLAFPGVFRGLLDARARDVTIDMLLRAADAIAHVVRDEELNPSFIIPTVFHPDVPKAVAAAVLTRRASSAPTCRGHQNRSPSRKARAGHQHGAHDQGVEQDADADDRAELGEHDQGQHAEHGEHRGQQDARRW